MTLSLVSRNMLKNYMRLFNGLWSPGPATWDATPLVAWQSCTALLDALTLDATSRYHTSSQRTSPTVQYGPRSVCEKALQHCSVAGFHEGGK